MVEFTWLLLRVVFTGYCSAQYMSFFLILDREIELIVVCLFGWFSVFCEGTPSKAHGTILWHVNLGCQMPTRLFYNAPSSAGQGQKI